MPPKAMDRRRTSTEDFSAMVEAAAADDEVVDDEELSKFLAKRAMRAAMPAPRGDGDGDIFCCHVTNNTND